VLSEIETLGTLAEQINEEHRAFFGSLEKTAEHGIRAGELLTEAKSRCKHGQWLGWLENNFEGSVRSAQVYMQLFEKRDEIRAKTQSSAHLSISGMLKEVVSNHRALGTGENEWYTPTDVIEDVRDVFGVIELDPASSHAAQKVVGAKHYFTAEDDALSRHWFGKVFLNPPYSKELMPHFASKLVEELKAGRVSEAIVLTHNYTETSWFQTVGSAARVICLPRRRIAFVKQDGEVSKPTQGQAVFYCGGNPEAFTDVFKERGLIAWCQTLTSSSAA
jgi:phage N-6-adenine-methyltransferase